MASRPRNDGPNAPGSEPARGLLDWVTDFDDPAVVAVAAPPRPARYRVVRIAAIGGLVVAAGTILAALLRPFEAESGISATAGPRVLDAPSASPSATAEAPITPTILPEECSGLYGTAMIAEFEREQMHINEVWTGAREAPAGTTDPELQTLLARQPALDCFWLDETGGTEAAVLTVASEVDAEESAAVAARLQALGFAHQNDRGGVRYFVESRADGESKGESHFLRDGVWLATNWYGFGPWGYTGHMAENVFA